MRANCRIIKTIAGVEALPAEVRIDAEITLNHGSDGYFLSARFGISLPGMERDTAKALIAAAHESCPYSKATRGNVDIAFTWSERARKVSGSC